VDAFGLPAWLWAAVASLGCGHLDGGVANALLPPAEEAALADRIDHQLRVDHWVLSDAVTTQYLQGIVARVSAAAPGEPAIESPRVAVVDDPLVVSAFGAGGGRIYVSSGALLGLHDEAELAALVAHQLAHSIGHHDARDLVARYGLPALGTAAGGGRPDLVQCIAAELGSASLVAAHTRQQERNADLLALRWLAAAGYDPNGMLRMLRSLGRPGGLSERSFRLCHPAPGDRQAALRHAIDALEDGRRDQGVGAFAQMRERLLGYYAAHPRTG
jgi:predicted Zn-dependent protease